jgi:two-component system OmpR family sensor kinase
VSLRTRLLLALGVVAVAALVVADVATYSALRSFLLSRVDQGLQASHTQLEASLRFNPGQCQPEDQGGPGPGAPGEPPPNFEGSVSQTFIQVRSSSGQVLCSLPIYDRSRGTQLSPRLPAHITGFSHGANPGGEPARYFNAPSAQKGGPEFRVRAAQLANQQLIVGVPLSDTLATLHRLLLIELAVTGGALILAGLIGWWLVHLGLRPLRDIERTAGAIAEGDLSHRVPGENPSTEVGRLARALNVMLGRIQSAFAARDATESALRQSQDRLRRFAADASHELRTPLAAVSAYAELFERGAENRPEDLARVMHGIQQETARMGGLVEDLLLLARLDEHQPMDLTPVDLVAVAGEAVEAARAVGPDWPLRLDAERPVEIVGDRGRLRQVFDNLLANVRAHTPPGTSATVRIREEGQEAICEVSDAGPGITAEQADRLFERFYRADPSRSRASGGAGLGLSIVAAIVAAHGGSVQAAPGPDGGAVFSVHLPVTGRSPVTGTSST